jgi:hypothetical protein
MLSCKHVLELEDLDNGVNMAIVWRLPVLLVLLLTACPATVNVTPATQPTLPAASVVPSSPNAITTPTGTPSGVMASVAPVSFPSPSVTAPQPGHEEKLAIEGLIMPTVATLGKEVTVKIKVITYNGCVSAYPPVITVDEVSHRLSVSATGLVSPGPCVQSADAVEFAVHFEPKSIATYSLGLQVFPGIGAPQYRKWSLDVIKEGQAGSKLSSGVPTSPPPIAQ